MNHQATGKAAVSRRPVRTAIAVAVLLIATLAASRAAHAATFNLIWNEWGPLAGYGVSTECNPGHRTNFPCDANDVSISPGIDSTGQFSQVTANPRGITTFVNAIGNIHFTDNTPDGKPLALTTYQYVYALRLPQRPTKTSAPWIGEQVHQMIQFWDGSNRLWTANKHTLEAAVFWKLNPWDPDYGKIFVYTLDSNGALLAHDTGITIPPDTNWHVFDVRADLANRVYAGMAVDNQWNPLTNLPLAQIVHPDWGPDISLILTAESENAYPESSNPITTQWTTQFKDPKLYRLD